ncbi:hypothetical protein GCK72_003270 [Caenorhabditis remanei]|uniref:VWFA domain-containing protein n=1 Tax=Caenorhabditis remanei TaxID=31234 RepID=A0A6A5HX17_CAERE|nr:hypothetical protein GCK72_003270 [Caenorhabditis remanei]KAF1771444.1 hypothetical protein GCK72_003270 [Caenorhabditis remanei]
MKLLFVLVFLIGANVCSAEHCGGSISDIWLDVVVVVDNSQRVNKRSFVSSTRDSINNIFREASIPRTRVGFVTYNSQATTNADLNKFKSYGDLQQGVYNSYNDMNLSPEKTPYIGTGLIAAGELLQIQGSADGNVNKPKVIIVYATALNGTGLLDPLSVANTLKSAGITIITIAVDTDDNGVIEKQLAPLASLGAAFGSNYKIGDIQSVMILLNCFCPPGWTQRQEESYFGGIQKYTTCFQFFGAPTSWNTAYQGCSNLWPGSSYLAMEDDDNKKQYIQGSARNNSAFQQTPLQYHIGLYMSQGKWFWNTPYSQPALNWSNWMRNYPLVSSSMTAAMNVQNDTDYGWENIDPWKVAAGYVCEAVACSPRNYCDAYWNNRHIS